MKKYYLILAFILLFSAASFGQGNAFSFQGRMNDGTAPANGAYDLEFRLYPSMTGGTPIGGIVVPRPNTTLINGVFSVNLDFGATAFTVPNSIFIEIAVRPNGSPNAYTILGPRQQLTVVPFSVRAINATNADNATNAQMAVSALTASNIGGFTPADFIRNSTTTQPNSSFNISGNGFINGNLSLVGNTNQNRDRGGFVKATVYVDQLGNLVRCFNGITGSSTGDCGGITVSTLLPQLEGNYKINFPFQVNDRFIAVTPGAGSQVTISASFFMSSLNPNRVIVETRITDVNHDQSATNDDFMLIVY